MVPRGLARGGAMVVAGLRTKVRLFKTALRRDGTGRQVDTSRRRELLRQRAL
jgi:hypothetical protein